MQKAWRRERSGSREPMSTTRAASDDSSRHDPQIGETSSPDLRNDSRIAVGYSKRKNLLESDKFVRVQSARSRNLNAPDRTSTDERIGEHSRMDESPAPSIFGRDRELGELREAVDAAARGSGGVVLIGGEAGVGKTRLCRETARYAEQRGFGMIWGANLEGIAGRPYEPWPMVVDGLAGCLPDGDAIAILRPWVDVLARLSPSVFERFGGTSTPPPLGTRDEVARVAEAIGRSLVTVAQARPILVVLDDMHWAEGGSIGLFGQVARAVAGSRVLMLATYRDVELGLEHPLSLQLGSLRRESFSRTMPIKPLRLTELREFVHALLPGAASPGWARAIWNETRGNPFLTEELTRHLHESGEAATPGPSGQRIDLRRIGVPEGIRQVVALRTNRLSPAARQVLTAAALFSGPVEFTLLQTIADLGETEALDALDELLASYLVRHVPSSGEQYEFVHSIARQAVHADLSPSRSVRLHRKVAEALLATYPRDLDKYASELAIQFHASASLPGAEAGVSHCVAAARQATLAYARDEAVTFLRMARDLIDPSDSDALRAVLTDLALAESSAFNGPEAVATTQALLGLTNLEDPDVAPLLARLAASLKDGGVDGALWGQLVNEGLRRCPTADRLTWARLTLLIERFETLSAGPVNAARWLGSDPVAVDIARTQGSNEDYARTLQPFDRFSTGRTNELVELIESWNEPEAIIRGLMVAGAGRLYHLAEFTTSRAHYEHLLSVAHGFGSQIGQADAHIRLAITNTALGELSAAQDHAASAREILTTFLPGHRLHTSLAWTDAYLAEYLGGDWRPIASALTNVIRDPTLATRAIGLDDAALAALALVRSRQVSAARELLQRLSPLIAQADVTIALANGAVALGAAATWALEATEFAPVFQRAGERLLAAGARDFPCTSLELSVARMAALQRDRRAAEQWFASAKQTLTRDGQRPLCAVADLDEARMLSKIAPHEASRISSLLDTARDSFSALGMHEWAVFCDVSVPRSIRQPKLQGNERPAGLTQRELEVLHLVSKGYSDRQISDELFLSPRTVNAHIRNMLAKTANANRTELSVWAVANVYGGHDTDR